jgi:hypothetical protein
MIGTDPTLVAVRKIDRAARLVRATTVDEVEILHRVIAIAPDEVGAAVSSLETAQRTTRTGWRVVADHELAVLG